MPVYNPNLNASRRRGVLALPPAPVEDDESEEDLGEEYMDGPSFTQLALTSWSRRPEALAKQRDEYDAAHPVPSKTNTPEVNSCSSQLLYRRLIVTRRHAKLPPPGRVGILLRLPPKPLNSLLLRLVPHKNTY